MFMLTKLWLGGAGLFAQNLTPVQVPRLLALTSAYSVKESIERMAGALTLTGATIHTCINRQDELQNYSFSNHFSSSKS